MSQVGESQTNGRFHGAFVYLGRCPLMDTHPIQNVTARVDVLPPSGDAGRDRPAEKREVRRRVAGRAGARRGRVIGRPWDQRRAGRRNRPRSSRAWRDRQSGLHLPAWDEARPVRAEIGCRGQRDFGRKAGSRGSPCSSRNRMGSISETFSGKNKAEHGQ